MALRVVWVSGLCIAVGRSSQGVVVKRGSNVGSKQCIYSLFPSGVTVQLSSTLLNVLEGNSGTSFLSLCVRLTDVQDNLDRDVTLLLNTQPSSAGVVEGGAVGGVLVTG